jgi:hypothetical protein
MTTIVIMPGGFHPFHAGHYALYQSAQRAFPDADVYVAATNDTSARPFPFPVKEKLAKLAGVEAGHFVQVKSPFKAEEITARFNPNQDVLIFVRSEKDSTKPPQPGGVKKDGSDSYLQPLLGAKKLEPFAKHAYMAYLPTVEFGPGMTSATEIRAAWPQLNERRKTALVMSLYPRTQGNAKLAATVVGLLDAAIGSEVDEDISRRGFLQGLGAAAVAGAAGGAAAAPFRHGEYKDQMTGQLQGKYSKVKSNDGKALLDISWPGSNQSYLIIEVPGKTINFNVSGTADARVKIGAGPVINTYLNRGKSGDYSWGAILNDDIINKILTHQGELKVEIPLFRIGPTVYNFTIEQDQTTRSYSQANKTQIQQTSRAQEKSNREIQLSIAKQPIETAIENNIEEFRKTLPPDYFSGGSASFILHKNGTISNLQWKSNVLPNKVASTTEFWQKVMPPLPPLFWGAQSELNVEVLYTGRNAILTVKNINESGQQGVAESNDYLDE